MGLNETDVRVKVAFDSFAVGGEMVVCAMYPAGSASGFFSPLLGGKTLTGDVQMRIENIDLAAVIQSTVTAYRDSTSARTRIV